MIFGLTYIPDLGSKKANNRDTPSNLTDRVILDFSTGNREVLLKEFLKIKDKVKTILEIGVARIKNGASMSTVSTGVFIEEKNANTYYVGVDIEDRSFVQGPNVFTLKTSSSQTEKILDFINDKTGSKVIDVLFIDGWHSVEQILNDWKFAKYVSKGGLVFVHDTNRHPGPVELIKAVDRDVFSVKKYCESEDDWGLTVLTRL